VNRVGYNVVLKYCEVIDEFIKIRIFSEDDAHQLLKVDSIPNKRAYQQLIVNSCILNYCDRILPRLKHKPQVGQPEIIEEFLYHLCVEVNPHLEIHNVVLPLNEDNRPDDNPELHLLEKNVREPAEATRYTRSVPFDRAVDLEGRLRRLIVGQDEAIVAVSRAIKKAAIGLKDPLKPIGSFLLIGQTGVGKTELAKALARCLYNDAQHIIRVDCSEYSQPHEYAKLLGAPPGYVGHNEGGYLSEQTKNVGSCIVLFDEIEKAHAKLHNLLLQVFDEGFITDSHGQKIPFHNSVIILTSNVGTRELQEIQRTIGFAAPAEGSAITREKIEDETLRAVKKKFRPEFVNRISNVIVFNPLQVEDCVKIVSKKLGEVTRLIRRTRIRVLFNKRVKEYLAQVGFSPEYGARELHRMVASEVENPLTEKILNGEITTGNTVRVTMRAGHINFNIDAGH
jgi:ATP-dependent Clp protease ATP-binding subunit ClpA